MFKIAICDDDLKFAGSMEELVQQESQLLAAEVEIEVFANGKELVENIRLGERYEIIFMDIEMEQVDGISAARHIREIDRSVLLIYISAYESYLKELFEVEPFRFLSKPLDMEKFRHYLKEAFQRIKEEEVFYQFTFNKEIRKVVLKNVVYFESCNRTINIYLANGECERFYGKLNDVEKEFSACKQHFLRIHQSFLVNYTYINCMNFFSVEVDLGGQKKKLKISEDRQKDVRRRLCEIAGGKAVVK